MEMLIFLIIVGFYFEVIVVKFFFVVGLIFVFGEVDLKFDKFLMKLVGSLYNIIEFFVVGYSGVFVFELKRIMWMNKGIVWSI